MRRICGDHGAGEVQVLQQPGELGDLVGLTVHASLDEYSAGLLVSDGEQVHDPPVTAGVTGARATLPSAASARRRQGLGIVA
jgi:hypothetical protein